MVFGPDRDVYSFCQSTDLHGFSRASKKEANTFHRIVWSLFIISSAGVFGYYLYFRINEYLSYPFTTQLTRSRVEQIRYPAFTICNTNKLRYDHLPTAEVLELKDNKLLKNRMFTIESRNPLVLKLIEHEHYSKQWVEKFKKTKWGEKFGKNLQSFTNLYQMRGHQLNDTVLHCEVHSQNFSVTTVKSTYSGERQESVVPVYDDEWYDCRNLWTSHYERQQQSNCFTFNADNLFANEIHREQGVTIYLSTQYDKYIDFKSPQNGLLMFGEFGKILLTAPEMIILEFQVQKNTYLPRPWNTQDCFPLERYRLDFYVTYTLTKCHKECETKLCLKMFNCILSDQTGPGDARYCALDIRKQCLQEVKKMEDANHTSCSCLDIDAGEKPCEEQRYIYRLQQKSLPLLLLPVEL